jgi:hypothetical protein
MSKQFRSACLLAVVFTVSVPLRSAAQIHVCDGEACGAYRDSRDLVERALANPDDPMGFLRMGSYYFDLAAWRTSLPESRRQHLITTGIRALDRALASRPGFPDAQIYKSLLLRLRATLERDSGLRRALVSEADELRAGGGRCDVTVPNGKGTFLAEPAPDLHGNRWLQSGPFGMGGWPVGTVVFRLGGPGLSGADGSLRMKFGWRRAAHGHLKIEGRRLDGAAPPLRADISDGYGDFGLQVTGLIFPTPGCWEVTAQVGNRRDSRLTFTLRVVKIGSGPTGYPAHEIAERSS